MRFCVAGIFFAGAIALIWMALTPRLAPWSWSREAAGSGAFFIVGLAVAYMYLIPFFIGAAVGVVSGRDGGRTAGRTVLIAVIVWYLFQWAFQGGRPGIGLQLPKPAPTGEVFRMGVEAVMLIFNLYLFQWVGGWGGWLGARFAPGSAVR